MLTPAQQQTIISAAQAGGRIIADYFGHKIKINQKNGDSVDVVTKADTEAEKEIIRQLTAAFPDWDIFAEESGAISNSSPYQFAIDPLDGSHNFTLGIPSFAVSIGLLFESKIIFGVVYDPILDNTYHAAQDQGAFLNNQPIEVASVTTLDKTNFVYTCGYDFYHHHSLEALPAIYSRLKSQGLQRFMKNWSSALDYGRLAAGHTHAMMSVGDQLYDFAAGKIIVREAGGLILNLDGTPSTDDKSNVFLAVNNQELADQIFPILSDIIPVE